MAGAFVKEAKQVGAFLRDSDQAIINLLALITVVSTVLIRVLFANASPWFPDGGRVADLLADLGVAYLAAWFFYYLVSWRPSYKARTLIAEALASIHRVMGGFCPVGMFN